jgi:hypothetical protein
MLYVDAKCDKMSHWYIVLKCYIGTMLFSNIMRIVVEKCYTLQAVEKCYVGTGYS